MSAFFAFLRENSSFLAAGLLLTFSSSFGQTFFISIFSGEIMRTFGLSDGQWGMIYALGTMASALLLIWGGSLTDRYRARALGLMSLTGLAASCLLMAINPYVAVLPVIIFLLRFTGQGMATHIAVTAMARWFVANRGKALSISSIGHSLGQSVLPLCFVAALAFFNWQLLWVASAALVLLMLPILSRLLRLERRPQSVSEASQSTGMHGKHWTRRQMLAHPLFWGMVPTVLGPAAFVTALFFQQVHLSEVKGWSHVGFVTLIPVFTATTITANLASGALIDRFGATRMIAFYQAPFALGFMVIASASNLWAAGLGLALIGIGAGATASLPAAFWAESYGTRYIGGIKSIAAATMVFGSALGPAITGIAIDAGYDFPMQMWAIAVWFIFASVVAGIAISAAARSSASAP